MDVAVFFQDRIAELFSSMDEGIKNLPNGVQLRVTFALMKKSLALIVSSDAKNILDNFKEILTMSSLEDESIGGLGTIYVSVWSLESTTGINLKKAFMSFSFHSWCVSPTVIISKR